MAKKSFLAALFATLLPAAAFSQFPTPEATYIITANPQGVGVEPTFKANKDGSTTPMATGTISSVLADIARDASPEGNRLTVNVQFGENNGVLNLNIATAQINESCSFILSGKITSASGNSTIKINGSPNMPSIISEADIANTSNSGYAIHNSGTLVILGGMVENTAGGNAIYHNSTYNLYLSRSPTINGNIFISSGNLRVQTDTNTYLFAPGTNTYSITLEEANEGSLVVGGGKANASSFTLTNQGFSLTASGNDLVVGTTTPIANYPTPAIHSEAAPTYYTMKGEPVGSTKPQKPGVYLVKQGSSVRKIVVR